MNWDKENLGGRIWPNQNQTTNECCSSARTIKNFRMYFGCGKITTMKKEEGDKQTRLLLKRKEEGG